MSTVTVFTAARMQALEDRVEALEAGIDETHIAYVNTAQAFTGLQTFDDGVKAEAPGVLTPYVQDPLTTGAFISMSQSIPSGVAIINRNASAVPFSVVSSAAQSADAQQWHDSTYTPFAKVKPSGEIQSSANFVAAIGSADQINVGLAGGGGKITFGVLQDTDLFRWGPATLRTESTVFAHGSITSEDAIFAGAAGWYGASLNVNSLSAFRSGAVIRGVASQISDLFQAQSSTGATVVTMTENGSLHVNSASSGVLTPFVQDPLSTGAYLLLQSGAGVASINRVPSAIPFYAQGAASQSANLQIWMDSVGATIASITAGSEFRTSYVEDLSNTGAYVTMGPGVTVVNRVSSAVPFTVQGASGQSVALQEWKSSGGVNLARVDDFGQFWTSVISAIDNTGAYLSLGGTTSTFINRAPIDTALFVRSAVSQSSPIQRWDNSALAALAYVHANGSLISSQDVYAQVANTSQMYMGTGGPGGEAGLIFGIGASPANLYKGGPDLLKTDDTFWAVGQLAFSGYACLMLAGNQAQGSGSAAPPVNMAMSFGTGAPNNANGADGDFHMRSDGGAGTTIYHKRAGAWVGIV